MISSTCLKHYQRLLSSLSLVGAKNSKLLLLSGRPEQTTNQTTFMTRLIKTTDVFFACAGCCQNNSIKEYQGKYEFIKDCTSLSRIANGEKNHRVTNVGSNRTQIHETSTQL